MSNTRYYWNLPIAETSTPIDRTQPCYDPMIPQSLL